MRFGTAPGFDCTTSPRSISSCILAFEYRQYLVTPSTSYWGLPFAAPPGPIMLTSRYLRPVLWLNMSIGFINIVLRVRSEGLTKHIVVALGIEEQSICSLAPELAPLTKIAFDSWSPFPNNLISEVILAKHRIHEHLKIVARGGVAVQVYGAGGLEGTAQLHQPGRHHHQVGHHSVAAYELPERP